jgi:hypothetical protein
MSEPKTSEHTPGKAEGEREIGEEEPISPPTESQAEGERDEDDRREAPPEKR